MSHSYKKHGYIGPLKSAVVGVVLHSPFLSIAFRAAKLQQTLLQVSSTGTVPDMDNVGGRAVGYVVDLRYIIIIVITQVTNLPRK